MSSLKEINDYKEYQSTAEEYRKRQDKRRQDGLYVLTIKNFRNRATTSSGRNNNNQIPDPPTGENSTENFRSNPNHIPREKAEETVCHYLKIERSALKFVRPILNHKDSNDRTVLYLLKFNPNYLYVAEKLMSQQQGIKMSRERVELLKNVGSFNVQLAIEERLAIKNLQKLKDRKIISGFGQNRFGSIYVALDKENGGFSGNSEEEGDNENASNVNGNISDTDDSPNFNSKRCGSGANTDREYIILNSPVLDSKLQHADDFRKLKMSARIFVHKNPTTGKYYVAELDSETFYRLNGPSCREILMRMNSAPLTSKNGVGESWISPIGEKNSGSSSSDGLYFSGRNSYNENRGLDQNDVVNGFVRSQSHNLSHQPTNNDYKSALARKTISNPNSAENHCKLQDWANSPSSNSKTNESSGSGANGQSGSTESPSINNNENGQMNNYFTNQPPNIQQIQPDYCEQIANEQMLAEYKEKVINEKLIEDLSHLHLRRPIRDNDIYNKTHAHCDLKFVESNRQQQQELRMKMIRSFENKRSECGIFNKTGCITHENVRDDVFINAHNPHLAPDGPSSSKQLATAVINQNAETSNENSSVSFASSQNSSYAPYRIGLLPSDRTNSEANNSINGVNDVLNVDIKSYNENKFKESINCSTL